MNARTITCDPDAVARALAWAALAILLGSVAGQVVASLLDHALIRGAADFLHVDDEQNLPTGFAVLLLLSASVLLFTITALESQSNGHWAGYWALLAVGFAVMAVDEAWSFHERLIRPGRELLGGGDLGVFFYAWVLFGIALLLVLTPVFLRFVVNLPRSTRNRFIAAGLLFVGGAIGTELVAGFFNEHYGLHEQKGGYGGKHLQYSLIATVEEGLEFAGSIVFIRALLLHMGLSYGEVNVRWSMAGR